MGKVTNWKVTKCHQSDCGTFSNGFIQLDCGHRFCDNCLSDYVVGSFVDDINTLSIDERVRDIVWNGDILVYESPCCKTPLILESKEVERLDNGLHEKRFKLNNRIMLKIEVNCHMHKNKKIWVKRRYNKTLYVHDIQNGVFADYRLKK